MEILGGLIRGILLILPGFIFTFLVAMLYECKISQLLKRQRNKLHFYVARDKSRDLWLYIGKPVRGKTEFRCGHDKKAFCLTNNIDRFRLKYEDFDSLKWEDEPVEVFVNLED